MAGGNVREGTGMARRPDPGRINQARRAAIRNVLVDESRMPAATADEWIAKWETEATKRGITPGSDWTLGLVWMKEQRGRKAPAVLIHGRSDIAGPTGRRLTTCPGVARRRAASHRQWPQRQRRGGPHHP